MSNENETVEAEIVEDEFKAPVLKDIKYPVTNTDLNKLLEEYTDIPVIDPDGENVADEYQYVLKGHKAFVKARNAIEKVRKELKAPSLDYGKRVDGIAKEFTAKLTGTEQKLFIQRKIVEDNEQRKQEAYEQAERERREAISLKIEKIKNMPLDHYNSSSEQLQNALESLRAITSEEYQEFYDEAIVVQEKTIMQLQTAKENKIKTEQAEKIQAENEARLAEEQRVKDEAAAKEREAFELEKAQMREEREAFEREKRASQEAIDLKNAEIEADRIAKEKEEEATRVNAMNEELLNVKKRETLLAMLTCNSDNNLLDEIIAGKIPNLKWEM